MNVDNKPTSLSPEGYHKARCIGIIQIGTIYFPSHNKWKDTIRLEFELPEELKIYEASKGEQPKILTREYTKSLYGKSHLKSHLITWFGEEFVRQTEANFDLNLLLGEAALIRTSHQRSQGGRWFDQIDEIHAIRPGDEMPPRINQVRTLVLTHNEFDDKLFNSLPQFLRNKIAGSQEFQKMFPNSGISEVNRKKVM